MFPQNKTVIILDLFYRDLFQLISLISILNLSLLLHTKEKSAKKTWSVE